MSILASLHPPATWHATPFGRVAERSKESGRPDLSPLSVFLGAGVVPRDSRDDNHNQLGEDLGKYLVVRPGDLVFNKLRTWQGGLGASRHEGIVSPAYFVCRPGPAYEPRFLQYLLLSSVYLQELTRVSKWQPPAQFDIGWEQLRAVSIIAPSRVAQRAIADYLDRETARIDALITKKQQMIVLFKERRQVLITSAVTDRSSSQGRGVNDRGWWTGQACAPWQIGRLKDLVEVTNGFPFDASRFNDVDGTPLIRIRDLLRGYTETYFDGPVPATAIVEDGDLLVGMDGDFNSGVWTGGRAALNQRMCRLRARTGLDRRFLWYLIDLPLRYINDLTYSTTVKHLSSTDLLNERIPLPPIARQRIIADYLDRETARIDAITATAEQQIALMRERRQALITAAVTGELEVSGVAA